MRKIQIAEELENLKKENEELRFVARWMYSDYLEKLMESELKGGIPTKDLHGDDYAREIVDHEIKKLMQLNEYFKFSEDYMELVKTQLLNIFMIEKS